MRIRAHNAARALPATVAALLAVILALTSVTMAVARGQTRVAGQVVLCSGYGVVIVHLDAAGNPVDGPEGRPGEAVHLCPDMVLAMLAALPGAEALPPRPEPVRATPLLPSVVALPSGLAPGLIRARGPPAA